MNEMTMLQIADLEIEDMDSIKDSVVEDLVQSIKNVGLLHPIVVNTKSKIVSGRHRVMAYRKLNLKEIPALQIYFGSKEKKALATLDENLSRGTYTALEYSRMLQRHKKLLEDLNLASGHGGSRSKSQNLQLESATSQLSKKTNDSERKVSLCIEIAKGIPQELDSKIKGTKIENHQLTLRKIAKAPENKKKEVLEHHLSKLVKRLPGTKSEGTNEKLTHVVIRSVTSSNKTLSNLLNQVQKIKSLNEEIPSKFRPEMIELLSKVIKNADQLQKLLSRGTE